MSGYRRFAMKAQGFQRFYLSCDLDEGILRYWPSNGFVPGGLLMLSENLDERALAQYRNLREGEDEYCRGVKLTAANIAHLEGLLTTENVERMRGIDNKYMFDKTGGGWCYRDGWYLDFYAEADNGYVPLSLQKIGYSSFAGDEEVFELVEDYVNWEILGERGEAFLYDVCQKMTTEQANIIVSKALSVGLGAIEEILWEGHPRLVRALDVVGSDKLLSYELSEDSFTVVFGNEYSRACKLYEPPNCAAVFGSKHVFRFIDGTD